MAIIQLHRRHTKKPSYSVEIDWSNPLSRGLKLFVANPYYSAVNGQLLTRVNGASKSKNNMFFVLASSQQAKGVISASVGGPFTVASKYKIGTSIGVQSRYLLNMHDALGQFSTILWHFGNFNEIRVTWGNLAGFIGFPHEPAAGVTSEVIIRVPSTTASEARALIDGVMSGAPSTTTDGAFTDPNGIYRIGGRDSGDRYWDGEINYVVKWNRALSDMEMRSFQRNPYQLLKSYTQYIDVQDVAVSGLTAGSLALMGVGI